MGVVAVTVRRILQFKGRCDTARMMSVKSRAHSVVDVSRRKRVCLDLLSSRSVAERGELFISAAHLPDGMDRRLTLGRIHLSGAQYSPYCDGRMHFEE